MVKIIGIEGLTTDQLQHELQKGGRFVVFLDCISLVFWMRQGRSDIYFIRSGQNHLHWSLRFTLRSLCLGWWSLPAGPLATIEAVVTNLGGGKNVTSEVMVRLRLPPLAETQPAGRSGPKKLQPQVKGFLGGASLIAILMGCLIILWGGLSIRSILSFLTSEQTNAATPLNQFYIFLFCWAAPLLIGLILLMGGVFTLWQIQRR